MKLPVTTCPACQTALPSGAAVCPDCREDLSALMRLQLAPYVAYNTGLRLAAQDDRDGAIAQMLSAVAALPDETEVCDVLGKLYAQKGDRAQARAWWRQALARRPDDEVARKGLAALDARETVAASGTRAEQDRLRRQRWTTGLLGAALGGLLVAIAAFVVVPALVPPAGTATAIAALTPSAAPPSATLPAPTPTPPPTATATSPAPPPTLPPSPTALPATPPPAPTPVDLAGPVQAAIAAAIADNAHRDEIEVTVRQAGNAVRLEGVVAYVGDKYVLESVAKGVPGVELVDVSGIQVRYAVRPGDSLSGIAQEMYGQYELYPYIASANGLADPDIIRPGQVLSIPPPH